MQARDNVAVTLGFANGSVGSILYVADGSGRVSKERLEAFSGGRSAILEAPAAKHEIDGALAVRYGVTTGDIRPWHYEDPFFQETPRIFAVGTVTMFGAGTLKGFASTFAK